MRKKPSMEVYKPFNKPIDWGFVWGCIGLAVIISGLCFLSFSIQKQGETYQKTISQADKIEALRLCKNLKILGLNCEVIK